jgi:hypothetical protein
VNNQLFSISSRTVCPAKQTSLFRHQGLFALENASQSREATNVSTPSVFQAPERKSKDFEAVATHENVHISLKYPFFSSKLFDMRSITILFLLAAGLLDRAHASPIGSDSALQVPLEDLAAAHHNQASSRPLHGRFLHITGGLLKPYLLVRC